MKRVLLLSLVLLSACATQIGHKDPAERASALATFRAGEAKLSCTGGDCLWAWVQIKAPAQRMLQAQRWEDLADAVMAADYDYDLAWFYLGLAASGLGANDAALTYLDRSVRLSIAGGARACAGTLCDGINLPADATALMESVRAAKAAKAPKPASRPRPARSPRPAAGTAPPAAAPTTEWVAPVVPAPAAPAAGGGWVNPVPAK